MSRVIVCHGKKAQEPFYIETIGRNIYTVEELCYYFWNYAQLLDSVRDFEKLPKWLRKELQMEEPAAAVETLVRNRADVEELAAVILEAVPYLTPEEYEVYRTKLARIRNMTGFERSRLKADDYVRNRQYYKAVREYERLLEQPEAEEPKMAAKLYHNMGVACSRMFLFREAASHFLQAFLTVPAKESMRQYKLAVRLSDELTEEDELVRQFPSSESMDMQVYEELKQAEEKESRKSKDLKQLEQLKSEGKVAKYYDNMEEILQRWRDECREYMSMKHS